MLTKFGELFKLLEIILYIYVMKSIIKGKSYAYILIKVNANIDIIKLEFR